MARPRCLSNHSEASATSRAVSLTQRRLRQAAKTAKFLAATYPLPASTRQPQPIGCGTLMQPAIDNDAPITLVAATLGHRVCQHLMIWSLHRRILTKA